ncbi:hypothetical protein QBC35DRAFT_531415 [Podospora australis]|uniref:Uncharacterized protein n=1 Tax=Podospora australis TaxID=1536484 RepID=A0AAN7AJA1_9PEZI|nr:hypothetical protein QBC35DRAFT_531415 [Podospora australis]
MAPFTAFSYDHIVLDSNGVVQLERIDPAIFVLTLLVMFLRTTCSALLLALDAYTTDDSPRTGYQALKRVVVCLIAPPLVPLVVFYLVLSKVRDLQREHIPYVHHGLLEGVVKEQPDFTDSAFP